MAKYGSGKYGSAKYGATANASTAELTWILLVDWAGVRSYDGTNEASKLIGCSIKLGRENYLSESGDGLESMRPATVTLTLDNDDRRYDPRYASGPLYPNVFPGKSCEISVIINSTGAQHRLFTGYVDNIEPTSNQQGQRQAIITCKGRLQTLMDYNLTSATGLINTTISKAIEEVLLDAGLAEGSAIDSDLQPVISFGVGNESAGSVINQLANAGLGTFFFNKYGKPKYYWRGRTDYTTHGIDEDICLKDVIISQPWEGYFNKTAIVCHRQVKEQPCVIFFLPNPITFAALEVITLYPSYDPSTDVAVATLEANTALDGTGTDLSTSLTLTTQTLGPTGGTVVYTAGATGGYITKLEIRGRRWQQVDETFNQEAAAALNKRFVLDSPYMQDRNYAAAFVVSLATWLNADRESLIVQLEDRPAQQFAVDLMDEVSFTSATFDINDTYYILGVAHEWLNDNGQDVRTTLWLQKIYYNSDAITAAPIEEIPAPPGYENPGGDEDTIGEDPDWIETVSDMIEEALAEEEAAGTGTLTDQINDVVKINIYHNDVLVGAAHELNFRDSDFTT